MQLEEARNLYCQLWREYLLAYPARQAELDKIMLSIQINCTVDGADGLPDWDDYREWLARDLPSYMDYWTNKIIALEKKLQ
jgi:hypothetical protein